MRASASRAHALLRRTRSRAPPRRFRPPSTAFRRLARRPAAPCACARRPPPSSAHLTPSYAVCCHLPHALTHSAASHAHALRRAAFRRLPPPRAPPRGPLCVRAPPAAVFRPSSACLPPIFRHLHHALTRSSASRAHALLRRTRSRAPPRRFRPPSTAFRRLARRPGRRAARCRLPPILRHRPHALTRSSASRAHALTRSAAPPSAAFRRAPPCGRPPVRARAARRRLPPIFRLSSAVCRHQHAGVPLTPSLRRSPWRRPRSGPARSEPVACCTRRARHVCITYVH
jgi:hypothetical protein